MPFIPRSSSFCVFLFTFVQCYLSTQSFQLCWEKEEIQICLPAFSVFLLTIILIYYTVCTVQWMGLASSPKCQHQSAILTFLYCLNRSHLHVGSGNSLYHSLLGNSSSQICCLALGSVGDHLTNWWGTVHASLLQLSFCLIFFCPFPFLLSCSVSHFLLLLCLNPKLWPWIFLTDDNQRY